MHNHQPNIEEAYRKARKNLVSAVLKMLGLAGGFCLALFFAISKGAEVSYITTSRGGSGAFAPLFIIIVFTALGIVFGIPDFKRAWSEYKAAHNKRAANQEK